MKYWTNVCPSDLNDLSIYSLLDLESGHISPSKNFSEKKKSDSEVVYRNMAFLRNWTVSKKTFITAVFVWKCYCGLYVLGGWFFFSVLNETNLASLTFISFAEAVKIILKGRCVFWYLQPLSTGIRRPLFFQRQLTIVI